MSQTTDCLIQQTNCGRITGNPVCPKCGASEQTRYTTEDAMILAKAQAIARYWQCEATTATLRYVIAPDERKGLERLKAKEAERQATKKRLEVDQLRNTEAATRQAEEEREEALGPNFFQDHPIAPQMILLPSGCFLMGSADNGPYVYTDEHPQHKVTIAYKLAIGRYPVTFEEWDACVADGGTSHKPEDVGWGRRKRPVMLVSWDDVQAYVAWLNKKLGIAPNSPARYRLPSEAEWEYACRAGSQAQWCFGDDEDQLVAYAWTGKNSQQQTHPVGEKKSNDFGLHDMHGHVREWVQDSYGPNYEGAPTNGSAWEGRKVQGDSFFERLLGLKTDCGRVVRGGGWLSVARDSRSARRNYYSPSDRYFDLGFRLARTLP